MSTLIAFSLRMTSCVVEAIFGGMLSGAWSPDSAHVGPRGQRRGNGPGASSKGHTQQLLYLRNRAAHHEPLHQRDLRADLDRSLQLAQAIHPIAGAWVATHQQLGQVLERRPPL